MDVQKLYEISDEDLARYFSATYLRVAPKGAPNKARWQYVKLISRDNPNPTSIVLQLNNADEYRYLKELDVLLEFPPVGYYNYENQSFRLSRLPKRQFKKALHYDNTSIKHPMFDDVGFRVPRTFVFPWSDTSISKMLSLGKPEGMGMLPEYFDSIGTKKTLFSRALDREISIAIGLQQKLPEIYFNANWVGIAKSPNCIELNSHLLEEEFKDRCIPHNIEVIVK